SAQHGGEFPETGSRNSAANARSGFAGDPTTGARDRLSGTQDGALRAGRLPSSEVGQAAGSFFEGLPGEFSQHDFGQVDVEFLNGAPPAHHFFASRLKYSRYVRVSLVKPLARKCYSRLEEAALIYC